jgi:hypothetical protein
MKTKGFALRRFRKSAGIVIFGAIMLPWLAPFSMAQSPAPDTIVQITAEAQGLELLSPDQVPASGTFWLVSPVFGGGVMMPPLPCPPANPALPSYQIANGEYLVDGTVGQAPVGVPQTSQISAGTMSGSGLETEASAVVSLINQIQGAQQPQVGGSMAMTAMDSSGIPLAGDGGSGGDGDELATNCSGYSFDTNSLWLQITNFSNGTAYANLFTPPTRFMPSGARRISRCRSPIGRWRRKYFRRPAPPTVYRSPFSPWTGKTCSCGRKIGPAWN